MSSTKKIVVTQIISYSLVHVVEASTVDEAKELVLSGETDTVGAYEFESDFDLGVVEDEKEQERVIKQAKLKTVNFCHAS